MAKYYIHRQAGTRRERCMCIHNMIELLASSEMQELILDGALEILDAPKGVIALHAIEDGQGTRILKDFSETRYICWEEVSEENKDKVPGIYGCWNKDNGNTTLVVVEGICYNKAAEVDACLITENVPEWVTEAGFPVEICGSTARLLRTDWTDDEHPEGTWRSGRVGKALWVQYGNSDVNILDLAEKSAETYFITIDGIEVPLVDWARSEGIL